jgi:hypothetical protein
MEHEIHIYIGCFEHERAEWEKELCFKLPNEVKYTIVLLPESIEEGRFSPDLCYHTDRENYKQQYFKLYATFKRISVDFDFIFKLRIDLMYKSDDYFDTQWLLPNVLLVPSTEFHCFDRWNERTPSMWNDGMCDQIVAGDKKTMSIYFDFFRCKEFYRESTKHKGIESILADYCLLRKLKVATFDLQASQPGGKFVLGNGKWLDNRHKIVYCCMRIAICMRGAISKKHAFFKKNDLYSADEYVDYQKCYRSILKYIVQPNHHYDFFLQSWNPELEKELVQLYNPVASSFEDNTKYNDEISAICVKEDDFGGISQALAIKKSIELKEAYEKEHKLTYDRVILYRYDVLLWKDINLETYDHEKIYVNAHGGGNGDFHFIMNQENARAFKYLYDSIHLGNKYSMHFWIQNYVEKYMKKKLYMDDIIPGLHQEVVRKIYDFSIHRGHLSIDTFNHL